MTENEQGRIKISKFELEYFNAKHNLTDYVSEINIFESITLPYITAYMTIIDNDGLASRIVWSGSKVTITYTSSDNITPNTFVFVVDCVKDVKISKSDTVQTYSVHMFSEELIKALSLSVGLMFKNLAPETMINTILQEKIQTKKQIQFDKTGMLDTINCANLRPFQAIDKIKKRAVSRNKKSSSFVFFENQYGYNFKTIEGMLSAARTDDKLKTGDRNFYLDTIKHATVKDTSWRQIKSMNKPKMQSLSETLISGTLGAKIYAYDINTGVHYEFKYSESKSESNFDINKESVSHTISKNIIKPTDIVAGSIVAPMNGKDDSSRIEKEIYVRVFAARLDSNKINIEIYGDSRLTVGTPIRLHLPVVDGTTNRKIDTFSGGIYLISKIRHMISPTGLRYNQSCELMRTGAFE